MAQQPWTGARRRNIAYGRLSKTRKLLRRLPDDLTAPIKAAFKEGAEAILRDAQAGAPRSNDGVHAADQMKVQVSRDGLSAKVGLIGKRANRRGFWLRFFEFGTKGVSATAKGVGGFGKGIALPPIPARPFLGPALDAHRAAIVAKVQAGITRALNRAAAAVQGGTTATGAGIALGDAPEEPSGE